MTSVSTKNIAIARWLLRIGLAVVFLYAAVGATLAPADWVGFLPLALTQYVPADTLLKVFSLIQFVLAVWLLSGWMTRYAAAVVAVLMVGIIGANWDALGVTFRDVAIALAAVALAVLS